jgi:hypothetical protein
MELYSPARDKFTFTSTNMPESMLHAKICHFRTSLYSYDKIFSRFPNSIMTSTTDLGKESIYCSVNECDYRRALDW